MPSRCSVSGCPNRRIETVPGLTIHLYSFPKNKEVRRKWIKACRHKELNANSARICNIHFLETDYERNLKAELLGYEPARRFLRKDAVPSLNLPQRTGHPILKLKNRCAVKTCRYHYAEFEKTPLFFKFPLDIDMRKKWASACKLYIHLITHTSEVCSEHFLDSDFVQDSRTEQSKWVSARVKGLRNYSKKELKKDAVPSLKLPKIYEPPYKKRTPQVTSCELNLKKASELKSNVEQAPQITGVGCIADNTNAECVLEDQSSFSDDIPMEANSFCESSDELDIEILPSCETQNQLIEASGIALKNRKSLEDAECKQQECPNCSEMKKKNLQLVEENKRLKDQLKEKNIIKLREELQKIFNGTLGGSQMNCLLNQDQKSNIPDENNCSPLQLSPIGIYRLYTVAKEPTTVGLKQLMVLGTDRTTN